MAPFLAHVGSSWDTLGAFLGSWGYLGAILGTPWDQMGTTWGPDAKKDQKSDLVDPPEGAKGGHFEHFSLLFRVLVLIPFLCSFFVLFGPLGT